MRLIQLLISTVWFLIFSTTQAVDLALSPTTPIVEINKTVVLSVQGAVGNVKWIVGDGKIQGEGTQVTYLAPAQAGLDVVTVLDSEGNTGLVTVVITPPSDFSPENAQWEIFTNRSEINALLLSEDGKALWVGTEGGLEKRDAQTGEIQQVFLNTDGLPDNDVTALANDGQGGIWIGTWEDGIAHYAQGQWQVFNQDNSSLPSNFIEVLLFDSQSGLWVGTRNGLANYTQGQWLVFNPENSSLPYDWVSALLSDNQGGLWIGTHGGGLARYTAQGEWQTFNTDNSGLPNNDVESLLSDRQGGLWIGIWNGGIAHFNAQGEWSVFNEENSSLPENAVQTLLGDNQGGVWVGTYGYTGLAHYTAQEEWQVFNTKNSSLPDNIVEMLSSDGQGGLWIGTRKGLVHYTVQGQWQMLEENLGLPDNYVKAILPDSQGDPWVGTLDGLAHYAQGQWQVFKTDNSNLLDNHVLTLASDSQLGGLWIGTMGGGLTHYIGGKWQVFNTENSDLPNNGVYDLLPDNQGGLWISLGTQGLAHYTQEGPWQVFNTDNAGLPGNYVTALDLDGQSGLWVGTSEGLAHYAQQQWQVFNEDNSDLPDNFITALLLDNQNGLWVGTIQELSYYSQGKWRVFNTNNSGLPSNYITTLFLGSQGGLWVGTLNGLAYLSVQEQWQIFDSGLPDNIVYSLSSDDQGGLWIGTDGGLAHLTFGRQTELCTQAQIDATTCQAIQQGQHAAIIVAAGGAQQSDPLWENTEAITTRIYRTFYQRGFAKSNVYYLSSKTWADFNGDGFNDNINRLTEDRHLTLDDLKTAFEWAKTKGKLDQPLYFFFMDHGGDGKLKLSPDVNITAEELKILLDDYQNATGNQMIAVIEACHSGSLIPVLTAPNRAVIASAKDSEYAYFFEKKGFSRFLAEYLLKGINFWESFQLASRDQEKLLGNNTDLQTAGDTGLTSQTPQTDDNQDGLFTTDDGNWLKQIYINGQFTTADATLAVENQTPATTLTVGQPVTLQAKVTLTQGTVTRVWAVIRPPAIAQVLDTNGTPILAFPRLNLGQSSGNPELWQATWQEAVYNGNYLITFYAQDNEKNITSSEQDTVLTVSGGIDPPSQAQVQIHLEKDRYQRGEAFKATLTEDLGWGYDLYAAVVLPDGNFIALNGSNNLRPVNEAKPWYAQRKQSGAITLFDLTLPADLPTGQYCLYGILSPEQNDVFETKEKGLWVYGSQCFEVD